MNPNQIVNMIFRLFLRRFLNFGVTRGMSALSGMNRKGQQVADRDDTDRQPNAADRQQQSQAEKMARQARKAAKLTRRL